jgi:alpha-amylase
MRTQEPLRFGRMYYRQISGNGIDFGLPYGTTYTLAFSRPLYSRGSCRLQCFVIVDATLHPDPSQLTFLYGGAGVVPVRTAPSGARFVQLDLDAHQLAILS